MLPCGLASEAPNMCSLPQPVFPQGRARAGRALNRPSVPSPDAPSPQARFTPRVMQLATPTNVRFSHPRKKPAPFSARGQIEAGTPTGSSFHNDWCLSRTTEVRDWCLGPRSSDVVAETFYRKNWPLFKTT
ncbi:hypothetical protein GQ55_8G128000 [Panicum hallii var. hallii]|uniref:Uncharacterized protein n=1 Tax=Panicum hallii var. hallii TaxID=1504633 RepID=A0A2T7CMW2_9POAL|nr:hypothetical protein GQ55_8G128000 [Panicum hallii var. hallii]